MVETKRLLLEPYLTLLSKIGILSKIVDFWRVKDKRVIESLKKELHTTLFNSPTFYGELHYYISDLFTHLWEDKRTVVDCYRDALKEIVELLFDGYKIRDLQLFKIATSSVVRELPISAFHKLRGLPCPEGVKIEHYCDVPYYIDDLREHHLHAGLAYRFSDVIDFVVRRLHFFMKKWQGKVEKRVISLLKLLANSYAVIEKKSLLEKKLRPQGDCSYNEDRLEEINFFALLCHQLWAFENSLPIPLYLDYLKDFSFEKTLFEAVSCLFDEDAEDEEVLASLIFIISLNELYSLNVHDRFYRGLDYFSGKFIKRNPFKSGVQGFDSSYRFSDFADEVYKRFFSKQEKLSSVELRMYPSGKSLVEWKKVIDSWKERTSGLEKEFGIIFHFVKMKSSKDFENLPKFRRKVYRKSKELANFLRANREYVPLFVGIDCASQEYWTPAWVFAPLFSFWKKKAHHYIPALKEQSYPHLKFTYHAGEDFIDVATGLKNVYEAVKFLELQSGDRIGHGLVLGLDVESYSLKHRQIKISSLYYFFHLLWLNYMTYKHPELSHYGERVLRELFRLKELSFLSEVFKATFNERLNAWDFRLFLVNLYESLKFEFVPHGDTSLYGKLWKESGESDREEFKVCHIFLMRLFREYGKFKRLIKKKFSLDPLLDKRSDFTFEEQLEFLKKIQEVTLGIVVKKGIVVEACPSSNLYIRGLVDYKEHLVVRLKEFIKKRELRVSLNTDNPLIFDTTILEEYLLINEALPEKDREKVIEALRKNARDFSFAE